MKKAISRFCMMAVLILNMALMCKATVSAKEITVGGQDIQAALDQAKDTDEQVVVIIPAGAYNFNNSLLVYSNTVIKADGANITVRGGQPALTHSQYIKPADIKISGGTWCAEGADKVINFFMPSSNIVLENVTVRGDRNSMGIHFENVQGGSISQCKIDGTRIGVNLYYSNKINVKGNTITNSAETGFHAEVVENLEITGNTISKNGKFGLYINVGKASTVRGNTLNGCALDPSVAGHGEGLVLQNCEGTWVQDNKVYNVESHEKNWGNGILISASKSITVQGNTVDNAGNHGLQATYGSKNIYFNDNAVSHSGNVGISISRASSADVNGGTVTDTIGAAIVYDGKVWEGKTGAWGTIDGCTIDGSTGPGVYIELADVTVQNVSVKNSTSTGVTVASGSARLLNNTIRQIKAAENVCTGVVVSGGSATLLNNVIRQDNPDMNASGIVVSGGKADLQGNRISNFGAYGIVQNPGGTISGSDNQVMISGSRFGGNAIFLRDEKLSDKIRNNTLFIRSISDTEVTCQNYWKDFDSGVVVNGVKYETKTGNGGYFTASYPQTDSGKVIAYVIDDANNAIILQAPADFDLNKLSGGDVQLIEDFVRRMYRTALGREADASEVQYYVDRLQSRTVDGSTVAQNFIMSPEFQGKKLSADDYITALYNTFFDRTPVSDEVKYWRDELESGMSRKFVLKGFVNSDEFERLCQKAGISRGLMVLAEGEEYEINLEKLGAFVERLYEKALGRTAEPDGKQYYIDQISNRKITPEQAAKNFFFSPEFVGFRTSNPEYIERLYQTFMGRTAEPQGMDYWLNEMSRGMSREVVLSRFAASDEFKDIMKGFGIR